MKNINEIDLHLYVLNKTLLDEVTVSEIDKLLDIDDDFKKEFLEIKEFYVKYDELSANRPNIITLKSLKTDIVDDKSVKLVAMQNSIQLTGRVYIKTFLSAENYLFSRLFYNSEHDEYEMYIISESGITDVSHAVVKLPGIEKEFIADENGVVKIKSVYEEYQSEIVLSLPLAKYDIAKNNLQKPIGKVYKSDKGTFELVLKLEQKVLSGSLTVTNTIVADDYVKSPPLYKIFLLEKENEKKYQSAIVENNSFSFTLPDTDFFTIIIIEKTSWVKSNK